MTDVNEEIVRLFFELNGFLVKSNLKYMIKKEKSSGESDIDLAIINPNPIKRELSNGIILNLGELKFIEKAIVETKGWHTERFTPSILSYKGTNRIGTNYEERIFGFLGREALQKATEFFKTSNFKKILVISKLPITKQAKEKSLEIIKSKGVDKAIEFSVILEDLIKKTEPNKNYRDSESQQTIRLLKNYGFLK